jgi:hypothetical protein
MSEQMVKVVGMANGFLITRRLRGTRYTYYMAVKGHHVYTNKNHRKLVKQCHRVQ